MAVVLPSVGHRVDRGELLLVVGEDGEGSALLHAATPLSGTTVLVPVTPMLRAEATVAAQVDPASERWLSLLERFALTEHATKLPHMLSRGTATAVQLAVAFASGAENYLFEEPFNGLDLRGRSVFVTVLGEALAGGACAVVATYDVDAFAALPHTVLELPPRDNR